MGYQPFDNEDLYPSPVNTKPDAIQVIAQVIADLVKMLSEERKETAALQGELDNARILVKYSNDELEQARANAARALNARDEANTRLAQLLKEFSPVVATSFGGDEVDPMGGTAEKIPTIKFVREKWNIGLKEAKDLVDGWQETGRIRFHGGYDRG